jgi:hypothetical protein
MAQSLQIDIKTTSDVPQAMDRAKAATTSFGKQVGDIGKKFGTSFKDIFLSFLGPMALLTAAIAFITKMIADQQQKREDANRAAIEGTNALMSAEDRYYENRRNKEKQAKETVEQAKTQREDVTKSFLTTDPRGRKMLFEFADQQRKLGTNKIGRGYASEDKGMQDRVQAIIAEDMKKNPAAGSTGTSLPNSTPFKAPEGFSNVVGVGANPVLTAMDEQLTQLKVMSDLLAAIERAGNGGGVPIDFTKKETPILK